MIRKLIEKLICRHKWEVHYTADIYSELYEKPVEIRQTLVCKECWKIKKITL